MVLTKKTVTIELNKTDIDTMRSIHSRIFCSCSDDFGKIDFLSKEQRHLLFDLLHSVTEYELP